MLKKIVFWIAIVSLSFWILQPIIFSAIGLEFNNDDFEQLFFETRHGAVPISVFLLCFTSFKASDVGGKIILKILLTLGTTYLSYMFMIMIIFAGICDWTNKEVLYTNKEDASIQIITRTYGCGVFDDMDAPMEQNFKMQRGGKYFIWAREINIDKMDKTKWK